MSDDSLAGSDTPGTFGYRLKRLRWRADLSQSQAAARARMSVAQYSHYEANRRRPNLTNAVMMAVALGVTLDEIVGLDEAKRREIEEQLG